MAAPRQAFDSVSDRSWPSAAGRGLPALEAGLDPKPTDVDDCFLASQQTPAIARRLTMTL
jgi:hypothetical protein